MRAILFSSPTNHSLSNLGGKRGGGGYFFTYKAGKFSLLESLLSVLVCRQGSPLFHSQGQGQTYQRLALRVCWLPGLTAPDLQHHIQWCSFRLFLTTDLMGMTSLQIQPVPPPSPPLQGIWTPSLDPNFLPTSNVEALYPARGQFDRFLIG